MEIRLGQVTVRSQKKDDASTKGFLVEFAHW